MPSGKHCWLIRRLHSLHRIFASLVLGGLFLCACAKAEPSPLPKPPTDQPTAATLTSSPAPATARPTQPPATPTHAPQPSPTFTHTPTAEPTSTAASRLVPAFSHIGIIVLENREFGSVIGSPLMPLFNQWAAEYTLLTRHYAVTHPSLPNYLALIGGDTFGIAANCTGCFIDAPSLPDLLEASGRTWKTYQEDLPEPCFLGDSLDYFQKHNPFVYFDAIRLDTQRCQNGVVSLSALHTDLQKRSLPDFFFITPNICNSAHDCTLNVTDIWLGGLVPYLLAYPDMRQDGLLIITWDEGQGDHGCCGIEPGGGRIATILLSPLARTGFEDDTPYTHYSILKTISAAWDLPELAHAADTGTALIAAPWRK